MDVETVYGDVSLAPGLSRLYSLISEQPVGTHQLSRPHAFLIPAVEHTFDPLVSLWVAR